MEFLKTQHIFGLYDENDVSLPDYMGSQDTNTKMVVDESNLVKDQVFENAGLSDILWRLLQASRPTQDIVMSTLAMKNDNCFPICEKEISSIRTSLTSNIPLPKHCQHHVCPQVQQFKQSQWMEKIRFWNQEWPSAQEGTFILG